MFGALFHSYLLAQVFGLYFIITAIILLSRVRFYRDIIYNLHAKDSAIMFGSSFALLLGLLLVIVHNFWVWEPRVVVTLIAWFILIKSVLWLSLPEGMLRWSKKMYGGAGYYVMVAVLLIVGIFLLTKGFYPFIPDEHLPFSN